MQAKPPPPASTDIVDPIADASLRELSDAVAQAVRALPEPYRQVLLLHLEHGLGGVDIAETLARPEATVRSQIHRGLDMLRRALPLGIAAASASGSAPPTMLASVRAVVMAKASAAAAANGVAVATIGGIMATKKVMFAAIGAVVLCLGAWQLLPQSEAPATDSVAMAAPSQATLSAVTVVPPPAPIPTGRQIVSAAPTRTATTLEVAGHWPDGSPAVDVVVACLPRCDRGELLLQLVRTGATGIARFDRVPAGDASVAVDRCARWLQTTLQQGECRRIDYEIAAGVTVHGRVVDTRGRPIANADIWLESALVPWCQHTTAAHSAADGSFALRAVQPGRKLRAQADGKAPSPAHEVVGQDGDAEIVLELTEAGGTLEGVVSTADGSPVADASVCVQFASNPPQFRIDAQLQWDHRAARSGPDGRFRITGLMPARWTVWACAPAFATWRRDAQVEPRGATMLRICLLEGAEISGRVSDAAGAPFERVRLEVLHEAIEPPPHCAYDGPDWARLSTTSAADGRYCFAHVMPGRVQVRAARNVDAKGKLLLQTTGFELEDVQRVQWNPILGRGLLLQGTVEDPDGSPLAGWVVQSPRSLLRPLRTDARGHFQWDQAEDVDYLLQLIPGEELGQLAVAVTARPSPDPLRIVVPWARIPSGRVVCQVLAPDGSAPHDVEIFLDRCGEGGNIEGCGGSGRCSDGRLRSIAVFPGRYRVSVNCPSLGALSLGTADIDRDETVDLGLHQYLEPGSLTFEVVGSNGNPMPAAKVTVCAEADPLGETLADAKAHLQPGRYLLSTWDNLTMASSPPLDVVSGQTTHYVFRVPDGVRFVLRIRSVQLENYVLRECWRDAAGTVAFEGVQWLSFRTGNPVDLPRTIPAGRYRVETEDGSGRKATTTVDIRAADPPMLIELPLPVH